MERPDASRLKVTPLDANGYAAKPAGGAGVEAGNAAGIRLAPETVYYLISSGG